VYETCLGQEHCSQEIPGLACKNMHYDVMIGKIKHVGKADEDVWESGHIIMCWLFYGPPQPYHVGDSD